jgi:glycosyltransferase involved in cell wall biosynthesis
MRILMVAHSFPRGEGDVAGAFLWRLAEALVDRGHGVLVLAPADRGDVGAPRLGQVEVRRLRYAPASRETLAYRGTMHGDAARSPLAALAFARLVAGFRRAIREECRSGGVHLVHAHWWVPAGFAAAFTARHGRPLVVTLHGTDVRVAKRVPGGRRLMAAVLRRANTVTAVSSFLASDAALALGVSAQTIPLTPMPMAMAKSPDPDAARSGAIFVGRLTPQKGVHHLLEALAILKRRGLPLDLTIVGDGPERAALKARAIALGLPVVFTGMVDPDQVPDHLSGRRVFILPSQDEGLGLVVAEALALGVPVVACRSGGVPDLMRDPQAGVLVPPGDPLALADAIRTVATDDRYVVGAMRAGRALVDRLAPEKVAEQFEGLYTQTRGRGSRSSLPAAGARR